MSDLIEHTMLVDNECPATGISLWIPHELDDSTDVRALRSELCRQWVIPPSNSEISAVVDGTFLHEHGKLYLKVLSIDRIDLAPNAPARVSLLSGISVTQLSPTFKQSPRKLVLRADPFAHTNFHGT